MYVTTFTLKISFIVHNEPKTELANDQLRSLYATDSTGKSFNYSAWRAYNRAILRHNIKYPSTKEDRTNLTKQYRCGWLHTAGRIFNDFLKARAKESLQQGYFETSDALLQKSTKYPRKTVKRHIDRLIALGFILQKVKSVPDAKKRKEYNYFLLLNPVYLHRPMLEGKLLKNNKLEGDKPI